ncbi:MAG: hypothetical protein IAF02_20425, partial [Anaerolineae bacterium]|nr:hypothetical protein [Anaerolineae bacterium]
MQDQSLLSNLKFPRAYIIIEQVQTITPFLVFIIVFTAIFTQTVTGFGLALVSMPLLI